MTLGQIQMAIPAAAEEHPKLADLFNAISHKLFVTGDQLQAARVAAWEDMLQRFSIEQRQKLANLIAHDWTIVELGIVSRHGGEPTLIKGERK